MGGKLTCAGKTAGSVITAATATGGPFDDFKNPYDTGKGAVRDSQTTTESGYVNLHDTSTTSIDVKTCFTVDSECSTSGNVLEKTITVE